MNGILIVNKPKNLTSRDVVNEIGKIIGTKKIGHTGTLDPIATGVLVLCVGKYTRLADLLVCDKKEYEAQVIFGLETDTLDVTGNILKNEDCFLTKEQIEIVLNSFLGEYEQEVPIYSAVKINGKKLYEYARENKKIDLPSRKVSIFDIELLDDIKYDDNKTMITFRCFVSKGTYIRSLIRDIAKKLNTCGTMKNLIRTVQGNFCLEESYTLDDIKNGNYKFANIIRCFDNNYIITADVELEEKIRNGKILNNIYNSDEIVFFNENNELLAIYKIYDKDSTKIKPWKVFLK